MSKFSQGNRVYLHNGSGKDAWQTPWATVEMILGNELYIISLDKGEYIKNDTIFIRKIFCHSDNISALPAVVEKDNSSPL